jgi:hypothetical protein
MPTLVKFVRTCPQMSSLNEGEKKEEKIAKGPPVRRVHSKNKIALRNKGKVKNLSK